MSRTPDIAALIKTTTAAQSRASDPATSAWVSANAGTGKTQVLTTRILRLLLSGTAPERILALTFTTAAAAEMSKRVFERLGTWVTATDEDLAKMLRDVVGRAPAADEIERSRHLFARAIETPGGLKVQTIHSFCERLLQRFPLEAGIPPNFSILDDATAVDMRRAASDAVLMEAARAPESPTGRALLTVIAYASDDDFDRVLAGAIAHRRWLQGLYAIPPDRTDDERRTVYNKVLGLEPDATAASLDTAMARVLDDGLIARLVPALSSGSPKTDAVLADKLARARVARTDAARIAELRDALLTKTGEPRSDKFVTKAVRTAAPELVADLERARDRFADLDDKRRAALAVEATLALATLAEAVMTRFDADKGRRALLDFDDLIRKTADLLRPPDPETDASNTAWVLFKLDGGLEHILVDEAQDTSPEQWSVVEALAAEFFATVGEAARTMFAVGDEKQSIYAFQGAAPEMFAATGKKFASDAAAAGARWTSVPLNVSFRTTAPVLNAVDAVFADPVAMPGLRADGDDASDPIHHHAVRTGQAGLIEIWPPEAYEAAPETDAFDPNNDAPRASPARRLAGRIARTIRGWLDSGEVLRSEDRPVRPSDILILVRRRRPFAAQMVAALKDQKIPVAGADRMHLIEQIAVKDLMVLGDFLTLPEDDLALATVLKSPLFGLDDQALEDLAATRRGLLWSTLLERAKTDARYAEASERLKQWRSTADYRPPFEFFSRLLDEDGGLMRRRMLDRLGLEAADPIDEFLNEALRYDEANPASMQGFLASLRDADPEIKRDMEQGRNEVRVMTVHGSKGLEAPIVIMPDTFGKPGEIRAGALVELAKDRLPAAIGELMIWPVGGTGRSSALKTARDTNRAAEIEEMNRLLYVAMTRPRDRLYVCGFLGAKPPSPDCWYEQIGRGVAALVTPFVYPDGFAVKRYECAQDVEPKKSSAGDGSSTEPEAPPVWATNRAPSEPVRSIPLAPSRLAPLETDDTGEPVEVLARQIPSDAPVLPPGRVSGQNRFLRGVVTHALLQHLPSLPRDDWKAAASAFVEHRACDLNETARKGIVAETLAILNDATFAPLFGPGSAAEVPIVADLIPPSGRAAPFRLNGQIDRLLVSDDQILFVDYKTNRPPPREVDAVPEAYRLQLAAYRLALSEVYPGRRIEAAIVWTDGGRLMPIPAAILADAETRLWQVGARNREQP